MKYGAVDVVVVTLHRVVCLATEQIEHLDVACAGDERHVGLNSLRHADLHALTTVIRDLPIIDLRMQME